jgi:hypothetical protein
MRHLPISLAIGAFVAAMLVLATFVALVGQALGKQNRAVQSFAKFILGAGLKAGDGNPIVTLGASWLLWFVVITTTTLLALTIAQR